MKPMRIVMLAPGTRGDVQPYVALGLKLQQAGYTVRVAAQENFASFVRNLGLEFHAVGGNVSQIAARADIAAITQTASPLKMLLSFNTLRSLAADLPKDFYAACDGADAIIYHPGAAIGYFIAREQQIPSILASPFPMTPTRAYPALLFYTTARLGSFFNQITHKVFEQTLWLTSKGSLANFWKMQFGQPPKPLHPPFQQQYRPTHPTLVAVSPQVFSAPADWPEHVHTTGYWFLDDDWQPPTALEHFLEQGPPPIYVGFGSMSNPTTATTLTQLVIQALQETGQRGILMTGWQGLARPETLPEGVFMLDSASHSWLFPKMAAVVHHGGAGTTAAGLRAGIPSIVIPHALDQYAWGQRIYELGTGPRPIPRKKLTVSKLVRAIKEALSDDIRHSAYQLGQKIQQENGVATAAALISQSLAAYSATDQ